MSFLDSVAWGPSWLIGKCSRARVSTLVFRLWACGRCCWRKVFSTMVRFCVTPVSAHMYQWARDFKFKPCVLCRAAVTQWIRSWASRTSTFSTVSWTMNRRTPLSPVRRRGGRAKRSCRTLCFYSHRLGLTPTWGWFWGSSTALKQYSLKKYLKHVSM